MRTARSRETVDQVREGILEKALDLLGEEGFDGLTLRKLGARTGMTAPNLYNYFDGKEEIVLTLMLTGFERLLESLENEAALHEEPLARARACMGAYLAFGREQRRSYDLMFSPAFPKYREFSGTRLEELSRREHETSMRIPAFAGQLVQDVAAAAGRAPLEERELRLALAAIWSLLHGMVSLANSENMPYIVDRPAEAYGEIIELVLERLAT